MIKSNEHANARQSSRSRALTPLSPPIAPSTSRLKPVVDHTHTHETRSTRRFPQPRTEPNRARPARRRTARAQNSQNIIYFPRIHPSFVGRRTFLPRRSTRRRDVGARAGARAHADAFKVTEVIIIIVPSRRVPSVDSNPIAAFAAEEFFFRSFKSSRARRSRRRARRRPSSSSEGCRARKSDEK